MLVEAAGIESAHETIATEASTILCRTSLFSPHAASPGTQRTYNRWLMRRAAESDPVSMEELRRLAAGRFGDMVKAVVDLKRGLMLLDADMHADQEAELLSEGATRRDLWGINLYPDMPDADWLEFDSMINLRPSFGNRSRGVDDPATRTAITELVRRLVTR